MKMKNAVRLGFCAIVLFFTLSPLIGFFVSTTRLGGTERTMNALWQILTAPSTFRSLSFSLSQALASSALALLVGIPGAYFVAKYNFPGRRVLLALSAVPFCLPPVLVVLSFILFYGRTGWLSRLLTLLPQTLGLSKLGSTNGFLYGFWGLVFIHAFYNFPIVIQNVGKVWEQLPQSREEAARTLGAKRLEAFRVGTLPYLLPSIFQSMSLIFLFCFFSFTIVLVFGSLEGSTLEVDIYRALTFNGDRQKAFVLAAIQTFIALELAWALARLGQRTSAMMKDYGATRARRRPRRFAAFLVVLYSLFIGIFFIGPLLALTLAAFTVTDLPGGAPRFGFENFVRLTGGGYFQSQDVLGLSLVHSLALSGIAALLAIGIGLTVAMAVRRQKNSRFSTILTTLPMAISPVLTAFGWAIISGTISVTDRNLANNVAMILAQSTIAWPFVAKSVIAALNGLGLQKYDAARTLGASPLKATIRVELGEIWPSILSAAAFALSMTIGDSNMALVVGGGQETLPVLIYRLISSYRFNEACAAGLILALLTGIAFFFKEKPYGTA